MRGAVFQCKGGGLSPDERLDRLADAIKGQVPDLVVCPELFMSGYNVGDDINALAEPSDGPFARKVAGLAREAGTAIVYGYPERDGDDIYNSAACIDASGVLAGHHRKLLLPPGFETAYFTPGDAVATFELNGVRCGLLVCYDAEFPENVRALAEAGADVVIVPTALGTAWRTVAYNVMPARAFENGVWFLYANHAGVEGGMVYLGASCIVGPDGTDAARAADGEELISAELDMSSMAPLRKRLPYLADVKVLREKLRSGARS